MKKEKRSERRKKTKDSAEKILNYSIEQLIKVFKEELFKAWSTPPPKRFWGQSSLEPMAETIQEKILKQKTIKLTGIEETEESREKRRQAARRALTDIFLTNLSMDFMFKGKAPLVVIDKIIDYMEAHR